MSPETKKEIARIRREQFKRSYELLEMMSRANWRNELKPKWRKWQTR